MFSYGIVLSDFVCVDKPKLLFLKKEIHISLDFSFIRDC